MIYGIFSIGFHIKATRNANFSNTTQTQDLNMKLLLVALLAVTWLQITLAKPFLYHDDSESDWEYDTDEDFTESSQTTQTFSTEQNNVYESDSDFSSGGYFSDDVRDDERDKSTTYAAANIDNDDILKPYQYEHEEDSGDYSDDDDFAVDSSINSNLPESDSEKEDELQTVPGMQTCSQPKTNVDKDEEEDDIVNYVSDDEIEQEGDEEAEFLNETLHEDVEDESYSEDEEENIIDKDYSDDENDEEQTFDEATEIDTIPKKDNQNPKIEKKVDSEGEEEEEIEDDDDDDDENYPEKVSSEDEEGKNSTSQNEYSQAEEYDEEIYGNDEEEELTSNDVKDLGDVDEEEAYLEKDEVTDEDGEQPDDDSLDELFSEDTISTSSTKLPEDEKTSEKYNAIAEKDDIEDSDLEEDDDNVDLQDENENDETTLYDKHSGTTSTEKPSERKDGDDLLHSSNDQVDDTTKAQFASQAISATNPANNVEAQNEDTQSNLKPKIESTSTSTFPNQLNQPTPIASSPLSNPTLTTENPPTNEAVQPEQNNTLQPRFQPFSNFYKSPSSRLPFIARIPSSTTANEPSQESVSSLQPDQENKPKFQLPPLPNFYKSPNGTMPFTEQIPSSPAANSSPQESASSVQTSNQTSQDSKDPKTSETNLTPTPQTQSSPQTTSTVSSSPSFNRPRPFTPSFLTRSRPSFNRWRGD